MGRAKISQIKSITLIILVAILVGFFIRIAFVGSYIRESGDLRLYADWAEKFWVYGGKDFYTYPVWLYAPPNYPPILSLIYGGAYWIFNHKYVLPQLHNLIRVPPAAFIIYFYEQGLYLLLKLPGILGDLGLTILIYLTVKKLTGKVKKAYLAGAFYLFNPVSIFLSGVWGQTDSLVSFFGLSSFITLWLGKVWLSIPLLFLSFYIKPNWGIFIPLYIFLVVLKKPKLKQVLLGIALSVGLLILSTLPFAKGSIFSFSNWVWRERLLPTATVAHRASVSAFNLHSILLTINDNLDSDKYLGISVNTWGYFSFLIINLFAFRYIKRQKSSLNSVIFGLFSVGFGSYLFLTNMLERYFFQSFAPMVVLVFSNPGLIIYGILINIAVFANIIHAFFRRTWGELADTFGFGNFLLVKFFSFINLASWVLLLRKLNPSKKEF